MEPTHREWGKMSILDLEDIYDKDVEAYGQCDCCGKDGILSKTVAYGIDTKACDICRGECDLESRKAVVERFRAEITVLQEARKTCRTLWCKAELTDIIDDVTRKITDIQEGFV